MNCIVLVAPGAVHGGSPIAHIFICIKELLLKVEQPSIALSEQLKHEEEFDARGKIPGHEISVSILMASVYIDDCDAHFRICIHEKCVSLYIDKIRPRCLYGCQELRIGVYAKGWGFIMSPGIVLGPAPCSALPSEILKRFSLFEIVYDRPVL